MQIFTIEREIVEDGDLETDFLDDFCFSSHDAALAHIHEHMKQCLDEADEDSKWTTTFDVMYEDEANGVWCYRRIDSNDKPGCKTYYTIYRHVLKTN